jgi:hypothetical protein
MHSVYLPTLYCRRALSQWTPDQSLLVGNEILNQHCRIYKQILSSFYLTEILVNALLKTCLVMLMNYANDWWAVVPGSANPDKVLFLLEGTHLEKSCRKFVCVKNVLLFIKRHQRNTIQKYMHGWCLFTKIWNCLRYVKMISN